MRTGEFVTELDLRKVTEAIGLVVLVLAVILFVVTAFPTLIGADQSFVVQSSSMSPTIGAGSVVYVNDVNPDTISEDDIITFSSDANSNRVTHRVVEVLNEGENRQFATRGDANEERDPVLVTGDDIIGRVMFHLPYIGYAIAFAGTNIGIAVLIVAPALTLAALELRDLLGNGFSSNKGDPGDEE